MGCKLSCCEAVVTPAVERRNKGYSFPANLPKVVGLTDRGAIFPAGNHDSVVKSQKMPSSQELNVSCNLQHISEREPDDYETDPSTSPTAAPLFMRMSRSDIRLGKDRPFTVHSLKNRPLKKSSSCSTIFLDDSTVSHPHLKNTIKCVSLAIYYHIKNNANVIKEGRIKQDNKTNLIMADERDSSLEIFDERLHPLTKDITVDTFGDMNEPDQKTIYRFVRTLFNAAQLPPECAIITLVYLERLLTYAETTIGPNSWKRIVLGSILLASKVWDDQAVWNVDYCQILRDIPVEDMNELERKFLELLQFNINVPSSVYAKYYFDLRTLADKNGLSLPFQQLSRGRAVKLEAVSKLTDYELIEFWKTGQRKWSSMESLKLVSTSTRFIPRPLVVCGPSGSGKSTLLRKLMSEFGQYLGFSISHTTRSPREGEVDGKDYHYTTVEKMMRAIEAKEFIEYTQFSGNYYGTSKKAVKDVQDQGKICILDVEIEGVKNLKKTDLNPKFVFIRPPGTNNQETLEILRQRLKGRKTESDEAIEKRLAQAEEELVYGSVPGNFDIVLYNDDVDQAYEKLRNFILPDVQQLKSS